MALYRCHRSRSLTREKNRIRNYCLGTSLVSLLIVMMLGLLLVNIALQWHQILKKKLIDDAEKKQELEIHRTLSQCLLPDLKSAGYRGCRTKQDNYPLYRHFTDLVSPYRFIKHNALIVGFKAKFGYCQHFLPETSCQRIKENSEVLIIYNIPNMIGHLKAPMRSIEDNIVLEDALEIKEGSVVLINDCHQADLFVASLVTGNTIAHFKSASANISNALSKPYNQQAEVVELETVAYYLAENPRIQGKNVGFSLYRDSLTGRAEAILEGVMDFHIEYVFFTNDKQYYLNQELIKDDQWGKVQGIRFNVLTNRKSRWEYEVALRNRRCARYNFDSTDNHLSTINIQN